jgi:hypothetical protein
LFFGKLFFEKKNGYKDYCNEPCRKKRYDSSEPIMKKQCRERQNKWADNQQLKGRAYRNEHCEKCEIKPLPKAGFCHIIKARNEKIVPAL